MKFIATDCAWGEVARRLQAHRNGQNTKCNEEQKTAADSTTDQALLVFFADDVIAGLERRREPEE